MHTTRTQRRVSSTSASPDSRRRPRRESTNLSSASGSARVLPVASLASSAESGGKTPRTARGFISLAVRESVEERAAPAVKDAHDDAHELPVVPSVHACVAVTLARPKVHA
jgi:hypothetical protein